MQGQRRSDNTAGNLLDPGDYALQAESNSWKCCTPNGVVVSLAGDTVKVSESGTISASVHIDDEASGISWHGDVADGAWISEASKPADGASQPAADV